MSEKRKLSLSQAHNRSTAKVSKHAIHFSDLPVEITNTILSYAFPEFASTEWTGDVSATAATLTHPLLQTNKALRSACLRLIHKNTVWIQIVPGANDLCDEIKEQQIPWLPPSFKHFMRPDAARIQLCIEVSPLSRWYGPQVEMQTGTGCSHPLIFPFSLDRLLYLINFISKRALGPRGEGTLVIENYNLTSHSRHIVQTLAIPVVTSIPSWFEQSVASTNLEWSQYQIKSDVRCMCNRLAGLIARAQAIVRCANEMASRGYCDEADLLCFSNLWILFGAHETIEATCNHRKTGNTCDFNHHENLSNYCLLGCQLRGLVHTIEHRARLCFAMGVEKFGRDWVDNHEWLFDYAMEHFYPMFYRRVTLTITESIEAYYGRAICQEAFCELGFPHDLRERLIGVAGAIRDSISECMDPMDYRHLRLIHCAAEMMFARLLDPANELFRRKYQQYMERLAPFEGGESVTYQVEDRAVVVYDDTAPICVNETKSVIWVGDAVMLQSHRGELVLRNLLRAQEDSSSSHTFAEWGQDLWRHETPGNVTGDALIDLISRIRRSMCPTEGDAEVRGTAGENQYIWFSRDETGGYMKGFM